MYAAIDGLIGGYIRAFSSNNRSVSNIPRASDVIELIESLHSLETSNADADPITTILLFSMVQASKIHLKHSDPVRLSMERSEYLNNLFVNVMERK